jgi:hypothetical protein
MFWQKLRVENFPQNFDKNFDVSFSSILFCFIAFSIVFSDGSSKALKKTCYKKIVSKSFYQKFDQKSKPTFSRFLFITFLGVSRWGKFKNTIKKYRKNKSDPSPFLASNPPTHHGGHRFVFHWRPLGIPRKAGKEMPSAPADESIGLGFLFVELTRHFLIFFSNVNGRKQIRRNADPPSRVPTWMEVTYICRSPPKKAAFFLIGFVYRVFGRFVARNKYL